MKIAVIASTYPTDLTPSAPSFVETLCRGLSEDLKVSVVTLRRGAKWSAIECVRRGVNVTIVQQGSKKAPSTGLLASWSGRSMLFEIVLISRWITRSIILCRRWKPDVVHIHWAFPAPAAFRLLRFLRILPRSSNYVVTLHGADVLLIESKLRSLLVFGLNGASQITSVTDRDVAVVSENVSIRGSIRSEPMPVADIFFESAVVDSPSEHLTDLLFVGRFVEKKGVDTLVAAIKSGAGHGRKLRLIGSGTLLSDAENDPRIEILGPLPPADVAKQMKSSSLLVCPFRESAHDRDGLPVVLLEAMASGLPILTTNIAGVTELESLGGRFYTLDKNFALEDLSHRINEVVSLLDTNPADADNMVRANLELVQRFSSAEVANRYEQIFSEALAVGGHK